MPGNRGGQESEHDREDGQADQAASGRAPSRLQEGPDGRDAQNGEKAEDERVRLGAAI